ncbi:MAG: flagellar filament capping protein FliD, partial [Planctomycetota bacterium]
FILVLTADDTGTDMVITDSGSVLSGLGISSTNGAGGYRNGLAAADSKIEATNDGFRQIAFDGTQADNTFLISYDQASKVLTLTTGDGTTDTVTLSAIAIASGKTETARFTDFGVNIVLDDKFDKTADILIDADTASITGGTGAITESTIKISDSTGDISGITSKTLTFGALATPAAITVTSGGFSGTFDGTSTGTKTVTLSDGGGNTLVVEFDVATAFDGSETAASIDLQELENLVASTGKPFDNQLQTAQTARFTADGLLDQDRYESHLISSSSSTLATLAPSAGSPGSFDIKVGSDTVTVNYLSTDTLSGLVTKINTAITTAGGGNAVFDAGTDASLMTDGDGVRLVITNTNGAAITLSDTDSLLAGLGVDNDLVIERQSNTISDLFGGVTLTLFQAEEETQVKIDVERDLGSSKTEILAVVEAYNAVKTSLNEHSLVDPETGSATEDTGVLFGSSILGSIESALSETLTQSVQGVSDAFAILAQIGIGLVDRNQEDPLLENTIVVDETKLDAARLNNPDDVRRLFAFDFSASDPRVSLLSFTGKTTFNASGYTLNLNYDDRYTGDTIANNTDFTQIDAQTGGPAADGISAIGFADTVPSGSAFRYSYDSTTEQLTLYDLTAATSQVIEITSALDAVVEPDGSDLGAGETASINFSGLGVTLTLSGDSGFARGTSIADGTLDDTGLDANTTLTGGSVTTPTTGIDKDTIDALVAAGAYDAAAGLLTLGVTSSGAGE